MTAVGFSFFFSSSPLWSRGPARYLMEKYWIWCVAETVHKPVKSFRGGVWDFTQQHCPPLVSLRLWEAPRKTHTSFTLIQSSLCAPRFSVAEVHVGIRKGKLSLWHFACVWMCVRFATILDISFVVMFLSRTFVIITSALSRCAH